MWKRWEHLILPETSQRRWHSYWNLRMSSSSGNRTGEGFQAETTTWAKQWRCAAVCHIRRATSYLARGQTGCVWENGKKADPVELCSFLMEYLRFILEAMGSPRKVLSKIISWFAFIYFDKWISGICLEGSRNSWQECELEREWTKGRRSIWVRSCLNIPSEKWGGLNYWGCNGDGKVKKASSRLSWQELVSGCGWEERERIC